MKLDCRQVALSHDGCKMDPIASAAHDMGRISGIEIVKAKDI